MGIDSSELFINRHHLFRYLLLVLCRPFFDTSSPDIPQVCPTALGFPTGSTSSPTAMSVEKDESSGPSLEKGIAARGDDRYHFDQSDLDRVQRRLKQRHVQMFVPLACLCVQSPLP